MNTTRALIEAVEFLLAAGHIPAPGNHPDRWTFQEDSEIHIVLTEALRDCRIAEGIDTPHENPITRQEITA